MKRVLYVGLAMFLGVASTEAKLTRLAHFRAQSLSDVSVSASAMSLAAEQPMLGMMAMGGMQQAALELFGTVDQNKPIYAVVYYKGKLPDLGTMDVEQDLNKMLEFGTNLAVAVMMPIVDKPETFLKSKGAVDVTDGVFKEDDTTWWACKDGYAFMATDPEALGESVQELRRGINAALSGMAVELIVEKSVLGIYTELIQSMSDSADTEADAFAFMGEFSGLVAEHQAAQVKMLVRFIGQIDRMAMGMNYDLMGGLSCEWFAAYAQGSEIAKMIASVPPLSNDLFSMIPVASPLFVAIGGLRDLTGETERMLANLREKWIPKIEDEFIRKNVADALTEFAWMSENLKSMLAFTDWDDAGRMVFVSHTQTRDNAKYLESSRKAIVAMMDVLKKLVPDHTFMTFDSEAMRGKVSFENLLEFIASKSDSDPDPEDKKMVLDVVDSIFGRTFEFSSATHDKCIREIGQAEGAVYSAPAASGSSVVMDRVKALLAGGADTNPLQVGFISLGAMIKHLAPRVMKAAGEEDDDVIEALELLSSVDQGGTMVVTWSETAKFRQVMNVSAAEFKGLVKFFGALSASGDGESDWSVEESEEADEDTQDDDTEAENIVE